jgi:polysaccharide export outer membrane protein
MIQLTRGETTVSVPYGVLLEDPSENIYLSGDDIVTVIREPASFTAFGAFASNALIPFEARAVSLEEAIARVGGLNDFRADPTGVFVFRFEPPEIAREIAPGGAVAGREQVPVVYHLDFNNVGSYFLARQFVVRDKDIVYVANARMNQIQKFLAAVGAALGPASTTVAVGASLSAANR